MTGTPLRWASAKLRANLARAALCKILPAIGIRNLIRSQNKRPAGLRNIRTKPSTAPTTPSNMAGHQASIRSKKGDQAAGHQRQLGMHGLEHLGKRRDDKKIDHHQRTRHREYDEHGVTQGRLDLLAHELLKLQVAVQADKDFFQPAGGLADAHHGDKKSVEHPGISAHRQRQFAAAVEGFAQVADHRGQAAIGRRFLQRGQGLHDRHAGLAQGVQLATEKHYIVIRDFTPTLRTGEGLPGGFDGERNRSRGQQLVGQQGRAGRRQGTGDQAALRIASGIGKEWHA